MAEVDPFLWADAGTFTSPHAYKVPGAGEVQPYTATATYTNASGQAILAALRIKSATGNLLGLVFPPTTIADGTASEVSFVPPFGSAATSSAPSPVAVIARQSFISATPQANSTGNITPGNSALVSWNTLTSGNFPNHLLDLTDPLNPAVITAGVYAVTCDVYPHTASLPATTSPYYAELVLQGTSDRADVTASSGPYWAYVNPTIQYPSTVLAGTWYLDAGGVLNVLVSNFDTTHTITFWMDAFVQKLS